MIRNLLDADEQESSAAPEKKAETKASGLSVVPFEVPDSSSFFVDEPTDAFNDDASSEGLTRSDWAVTARPDELRQALESDGEALMIIEREREKSSEPEGADTFAPPAAGTLFQSETPRESTADTLRRTGLAWSASVVLGGSVIFMMLIGWFADLLLGSSPIGVVGGIVIGAIVGFVQFFRLTSQIYK